MGAPVPDMNAACDATTEALLDSLRTISAAERRKHASVFSYWLSIRGERPFPAIRDLDPLEISDAGPYSVLLEMIGGGQDATVRHLGKAISGGIDEDKLSAAPNPSLLTCIAKHLPVVASSRQAFAFEDEFTTAEGKTRCWVTLLPFSATGTWIDYVYGFVSLEAASKGAAAAPEPESAAVDEGAEAEAIVMVEQADLAEEALEVTGEEPKVEEALELTSEAEEQNAEPATEETPSTAAQARPGFSAKLLDKAARVSGFYGRVAEFQPTEVSLSVSAPEAPAPAAEQPEIEPAKASEGPLQDKLDDLRAKADEARLARLRSELALYEGLSAAYDFALDAEHNAEEYLRLVEAEGLKIQLRSPMKPVVKLAFDGKCDEATIARLEGVLAWALKQDLPRGSLAERLQAEGGLEAVLQGLDRAA